MVSIRCLLVLGILSVTTVPAFAQNENLLEKLILETEGLRPYVDSLEQYEIQVLYSRVHRDEDGSVRLETYYWGADSTQYFYPASTIKMPVAALALQELHELNVLGLDRKTPLYHGKGRHPKAAPQTEARFDTTAENGLASVEHYARKIFLVSDNDAYCRLFELLGPTKINRELRALGVTGGRIVHRVGVGGFDTETHAYLNPVAFGRNLEPLYQLGERHDTWFDTLPAVKGQIRGRAYTKNDGTLVNSPFDFSHKNYLSLRNLHDVLVKIVLPEALPENRRFRLAPGDRQMMLDAMATVPRKSKFPDYRLPDNYAKFWIWGDESEDFRIPATIKSHSKSGWAYGYLTDAAYVVDEVSGAEFIVVGTIHVNRNRTFNDGVYEYEKEGLPFFGRLGRALLRFESAN